MFRWLTLKLFSLDVCRPNGVVNAIINVWWMVTVRRTHLNHVHNKYLSKLSQIVIICIINDYILSFEITGINWQ